MEKPPIFWYKVLKKVCKNSIFEEIQGDLEENFHINRNKKGEKYASKNYRNEVLNIMIRRSSMKKMLPKHQCLTVDHFKGVFKISFRNIIRQKLFSFINIFSLSLAMSVGLLVIGMITDLLRFDEFHQRKNEIYRIISTPVYNGYRTQAQATAPLPLGEELVRQIPGVKATRLGRDFSGYARSGNKRLELQGIYADQDFLDFLTFTLVAGDPEEILKEPFSLVISERYASEFFKDQDPIGQSVEMENQGTFIIRGIIKDPPKFSHIQFQAIASLSSIRKEAFRDWSDFDRFYIYLLIPGNNQKKAVENWLENNIAHYFKNPEKLRANFELQPINEIVPGRDLSDQIGPKMMTLPIIILSAIALAILLSAVFNYTNLSMARALRRVREVGVRKVNGASRSSIFWQFTLEAIVLSVLSLGLGILLFSFLRHGFKELIPRANEVLNLALSWKLVGYFFLFSLFTGMVAGYAPSVFFSRLPSISALRSADSLRTLSGISFRKGLIVGQFSLSIIFILAVVITYKQYSFSINHDMGFDQKNILNIEMGNVDPDIFRNELQKIPEVEKISFSSFIPGLGSNENVMVVDQRNGDSLWVNSIQVSETYIDNLDIELLAGRNVESGENKFKKRSVLVNEAFVRQMGFGSPIEAIGTQIQMKSGRKTIAGVVKDFHSSNLEDRITGLVLRNIGDYNYANVKISTNNIRTTLEEIESVWDKLDPYNAFHAKFHEDQIQDYYQFLVNVMKLLGFVGFLAISISTLGLLGMVVYMSETRKKEIGIRKTFGAGVKDLILLLSKGFIKLIAIAIFIGVPVCYFIFDRLILPQHYYRVQISFIDISIAVLVLFTIGVLTIITQTWKASETNPAVILRDE